MRPVLRLALPVLYRLRRLYWRVIRPRTHGVRVLIRHPGTGKVLLVRHTYGPRDRWYPPGGGYRPDREPVIDAARREVREEVGIDLDALTSLGVYTTKAGGNHDTVALFAAVSDAPASCDRAEIAEHRWVHPTEDLPFARVTRHALDLERRRAGVAV